MRKSWSDYFLSIAKAVAERSTCPRAHVGAVITNAQNIILATGYNGSPRYFDHCDDVGCKIVNNHCVRTIHAEINAIIFAGLDKLPSSSLYVWGKFPCSYCSNIIANTGISKIIVSFEVWEDADEYAKQILKEAHIKVYGIPNVEGISYE